MQDVTVTPAVPPAPRPVIVELPAQAGPLRPLTDREISAIRDRRGDMSTQLNSAVDRRNELAGDLKDAPPGTEQGILDRIQLLDARILQIEKDIEASGQMLRSGMTADNGTMLVPPRQGIDTDTIERTVGITTSVLVPVFLAVLAMRWISRRRGGRADERGRAEQEERLERIEQAVDAVALEVERVGEAQRFQAKVLAEANLMPELGSAPVPEPVRVREYDEARARYQT